MMSIPGKYEILPRPAYSDDGRVIPATVYSPAWNQELLVPSGSDACTSCGGRGWQRVQPGVNQDARWVRCADCRQTGWCPKILAAAAGTGSAERKPSDTVVYRTVSLTVAEINSLLVAIEQALHPDVAAPLQRKLALSRDSQVGDAVSLPLNLRHREELWAAARAYRESVLTASLVEHALMILVATLPPRDPSTAEVLKEVVARQ